MKKVIKKTLEGVVISNKMQKTIVVEIKRLVKHPVFEKYYRVRKKYKAHDEKSECQVGDTVLLLESRPLSREKRWAVVKIVKRAA